MLSMTVFTQVPPIEPGVSQTLAKWRAAHYSDVRYKLNLTLEKMSPVLKGTIEIRLNVRDAGTAGRGDAVKSEPGAVATGLLSPIILDWRKIKGYEGRSTISNVSINGREGYVPPAEPIEHFRVKYVRVDEQDEHLIFRDGVVLGENVIKLDFTSPILTSGSAITRYVDKEDGAEYIYSLFVPSDASTAFPVFDQPDLKARFTLNIEQPIDWTKDLKPQIDWKFVSNTLGKEFIENYNGYDGRSMFYTVDFPETKPISTYVFAFAAGPFERVSEPPALAGGTNAVANSTSGPTVQRPTNATSTPPAHAGGSDRTPTSIYVRRSQAAKFKPHAAEVFRLNREGVKFLETYFDYKFPFPKYDIVLIPEFPFGGMEHAGATFLREASVIFPQEPTKNDYISRANLIFHEAAHQWFGDTVTMKWFDDLWLKEGFAEFMAYKTLEKVMPEVNAWKVFFERNKQAAYLADSTRGTTPIYQQIANLNSAKSAYGNIVYRKAPSFLKQAEFYLGPDKFQTAVRAFLKKHEYANAGWEDLVKEFEKANGKETPIVTTLSQDQEDAVKRYEEGIGTDLTRWAQRWVIEPEVFRIRIGKKWPNDKTQLYSYFYEKNNKGEDVCRPMKFRLFVRFEKEKSVIRDVRTACDPLLYDPTKFYLEAVNGITLDPKKKYGEPLLIFPNYQDYGYGIFLLDDKSRDYVLKNIQNEKDDFLRTMMWGSLWNSVREAELDPREYVELVIKNLSTTPSAPTTPSAEAAATPPQAGGELIATPPNQGGESDESTIQTLLGRVSTAMTYYMSEPGAVATGLLPAVDKRPDATAPGSDLPIRIENLLIDRIRNAPTLGQRITFYRAFLNVATSENARGVLKQLLKSEPGAVATGLLPATKRPLATAQGSDLSLKTKDRFDIVTRLIILGDPDAPALLSGLEKTETSDEAKRYAYAAKAGIATAENKAKYWTDFTTNKEISESWIEAAFGPFNSVRHVDLTLPYLERALKELPSHKRSRKIFFVNEWLAAFIGGQRSEGALNIVNKFLTDNPNLDKDLRLKILENVDLIERAVKIRSKYAKN
jgi:aminopeptidase N